MPLSKQNTRLHLHFEQWYSSGPGAHEIAVEISSWSGDSWGDWRLLAHLTRQVSDGARRRVLLDLTEYAGQRIRLGFYAATKAVDGVGARDESAEPQMSQMPREAFWIVTEVALREQETPQHVPAKEEVFVQTVGQAESTQVYFEDFEGGWGDWSASNGIWQVGTPTTGPGSCHGGSQCAATVLDGNYPQYTDSRLISPPLDLPLLAAGDALFLRFWQWYSYADDDGQIQISTWDGAQWGDWVSLQTVDGSADWHLSTLDLTAYTGERVRLGFLHRAGYFTSAGWFIDDITLSQFTASTIPIGESTSGSFDGEGDRQYFAVEVPPDGHLYIRLNILDGLGIYEAYVRCGALPTLGEYDYSFTVEDGEGELLIPNAPPGTCYVMLYADSLAGGSGDYELQVDFNTGVFITSVTPESVGNAVPATFILEGAGFSPSSTVSLVNGGTTVPADGLFFVSAARLEAEVDVTTLSAGTYALRVETGAYSDEIEFELVDGGEAVLETNLVVPSQVGYHALATIYVEYTNTGDVAMPAPLLEVSAQQNGSPGALLTLDESLLTTGFWTSAIPEGFANSVQFLAQGTSPGILQPGESGRVPVYYAGWQQPWDLDYPPILFELGVLTADNTSVIDWAALEEYMRPPSIPAEAWTPVFANLQAQTGTTWGDYVGMLNDNARYLARLGEDVTDIRDLLAFEVSQAEGLTLNSTLASSVDSQVQAPGPSLTFARSFGVDIPSRYALGRLGRGWSDNWDRSLVVANDGTVTIIGPYGSRRIFQPDSRSSAYFAEPGDYGTLTDLGGGAFSLTESGGDVYVFRADGKLDFVEDTHGNRITYVWSGDLLTRLAHSAGPYLDLAYEGDRVRSVTDSVGRTTTFVYDAGGEHLQSATDYRGQTTLYTYGSGASEHALALIQHPDGTESEYGYDAFGRLSSKTGCGGSPGTTTYTYDAAGKVVTTDPLGHSNETYLDHYGRVARAVDPLGNITSRNYDEVGNLKEVIDLVGHKRRYNYDERGNVLSETDELGSPTRYSYGALDRLEKLIDANGNVTRYDYETDGDLVSITYENGSIEGWSYDTQGDRLTWTNRRGQTIDYTNDAVGRMTQRDYPDGTQHTFEYDEQGNLTAYTDPLGTTTREFDENGRLAQITYPGDRWLRYTYDNFGRRSSVTDQLGHQTNYHYDEWGRLESLSDESGVEIVRYAYNDAGQLVLKTLGNGVYTTYSYDATGQLLELSNRKPNGSTLSNYSYTYDERGRRSTMTTIFGPGDPRTDLAGTWTYDYDDTGQLTGWTAPNGRQVEYSYDALGNRLSVLDDGVDTDYLVNALNQYTQVGDTTYEYDADGNLTSQESSTATTQFQWTADNKLVQMSGPEGDWSNDYDANGSRVRVDDDGTISEFVFDPSGLSNLVGAYDGTGTQTTWYEYGGGLISSENGVGGRSYYTFDALGSTSELTDQTGDLVGAYGYEPFGTVLSFPPSSNFQPFQFIGALGVETSDANILVSHKFHP